MRKRRLQLKRMAAGLLAFIIIFINFLPVATLAEGNFSPGNFNSGTFSPGTFNPGSFSPGTFNPGTFTPGEINPGTFNPGAFTPGEFSPGQFSPGQFSPGQFNPGETSPGHVTPGGPSHGNVGNNPATNPGGNQEGQNPPSQFNPPSIDLPGNVEHPGGNGGMNNPGTSNPGIPNANEQLPFPYEDNEDYKAIKFITKDLLFPAITGLDKHTLVDIDWNKYGEGFHNELSKSILKNQLEGLFKGDSFLSNVGNLGLDVWSGVDNTKHVGKFLNSWSDIKTAWNTARAGGSFSAASGASSFLSNATKTFDMGTGIAGKAAPWMAVISTGISSAETVMNFANGKTNDGIASLGETLMSGAVVLSATGVGAPIAAGVAVVGGLLWAGAKIYKHRKTIVKIAKGAGVMISNAAKATGDAIKGGFNAVKSGFKKVAGWFG